MKGKAAKVKNLTQNGKNNKSNIGVSISKPTGKPNVSVPDTRSKSTKLVTGVRIQGPFRGRSNVNSQTHQNGSLLKNDDLKKTSAKPLPRQSVTTRASLASQIINENEVSKKCDPSPVKLRRSLRNAQKSPNPADVANKSHVCDENNGKCHDSELVVKLRKSLPDSADKKDVSFQIYVEDQSSRESKVLRRSSRLSVRKSLTSDKSTENGSLYISALEDM